LILIIIYLSYYYNSSIQTSIMTNDNLILNSPVLPIYNEQLDNLSLNSPVLDFYNEQLELSSINTALLSIQTPLIYLNNLQIIWLIYLFKTLIMLLMHLKPFYKFQSLVCDLNHGQNLIDISMFIVTQTTFLKLFIKWNMIIK